MSEPQLPSLTLKDRINYPYILAGALLKFQEAIVKVEGQQSVQEVTEASLCLYNSIPSSWYDEDFQKDMKKVYDIIKVDMRREWCGRKVGQPQFKKEKRINPYKLYLACVNLLDRKDLLTRRSKTEKHLGEEIDNNGVENQSEEDY